jgi:hypothetical protein
MRAAAPRICATLRGMRHNALAPLRDTLLLALGLGGCTPRPAGANPDDEGRPPAAQTGAQPAPAANGGHVREEDNTVHRVGGETCLATNPRSRCSDPGTHNASTCSADTDCKDGPNPRCVQDSGQVGEFCQCDYSCATDADCKTGEACVCGEALGGDHHSMCVTARCQQDSDCASGICGLSVHNNGCFETRILACRTAADTCKRDADCDKTQVCAHDPNTSTWTCQGWTCIVGRPLLVDGAARTAAGVPRGDWHDPIHISPPRDFEAAISKPAISKPTISKPTILRPAISRPAISRPAISRPRCLDPRPRHRDGPRRPLASDRRARARLRRQLRPLHPRAAGPRRPARAARRDQRAALDEVEHARLAFTLASRFAGRPVGPGPLRTADLDLDRPLAAFVAALVQEGCVGETLGAAEAELLAEHADPRLAARLLEVAADETRHAALAWRTLRWLQGRHGEPVRRAAHAALDDCAAQLAGERAAVTEIVAPTWGLLPRATLLAHRRLTLDAVVRPLLAALLDDENKHSAAQM